MGKGSTLGRESEEAEEALGGWGSIVLVRKLELTVRYCRG